MKHDDIIANRLKSARIENGISQRRLGCEIGLDPSVASSRMNHYETGRHRPDYSLVQRMAKILDRPTAYFFCEDDHTANLLVLIDQLEPRQKQRLTQFIEQLINDLPND